MPERLAPHVIAFFYALAAITGGLGGCAAAIQHSLITRKSLRVGFISAYVVLGIFSAGIVLSAALIAGMHVTEPHIIGGGLLTGFAISTMMATGNLAAVVTLRRLGWEAAITIRRSDEDRRHHEGEEGRT
ncbi:hypothetical protein [Thioalbus denitrificans]|uniref:Uncharacterized protein n=1 Tax=Thioalbus denitrificans TaxID=547122 RepID=A0A369CDV4_9GAMM|nr:hypothetical protein [Thioalbus denitrificans]RCX32089.1 hypothetical protein DFQ59_102442 [Thioalbus denitrificans]